MAWAWQQPIPSTAKLVLLAIADHADDKGKCWPGLSGIAKKCRLSQRAVISNIEQLQQLGLVQKQIRYYESGAQRSNLYILSLKNTVIDSPPGEGYTSPSEGDSPSPMIDVHPGGESDNTPGGERPSPKSSNNRSKNQHNGHGDLSSPVNGSRFTEYWAILPAGKKVKRKEAEKLWKSKKLDSIADQIIADVQNRIANDDRWRRGFIPDPPTYLRQERWTDELTRSAGNGQDQATNEGPRVRYLNA